MYTIMSVLDTPIFRLYFKNIFVETCLLFYTNKQSVFENKVYFIYQNNVINKN